MKIEIAFVKETPERAKQRFLNKLPQTCEVEVKDDAKVLVATTNLFCHNVGAEARRDFIKRCRDRVTILDNAEEACAPDWNLFDYCLGQYDPTMQSERFLSGFEFLAPYEDTWRHQNSRPAITVIDKPRFCNFIYSNPSGHSRRAELFDLISRYKKVHSLGSYLNNTPGDNRTCRNEVGENRTWYASGIELRKPYKFSIAAENAFFPGYTSEKINLAFISDTIPIYWGNPFVSDLYNPDSFVDATKLSFEQLLEKIIYLDTHPRAYLEMLNQPHILPSQYELRQSVIEAAREQLVSILRSPEQRKGAGTYPDFYINEMIPSPLGVKKSLRYIYKSVCSRLFACFNTNK